MLIRLIYASTASEGVGMHEFKSILQQAQVNNQRQDLTGVLAFNSKVFLQALEGSREQVNELYARLLRDPRHHTVAMLDYAEIDEREWTSWSMGFAAPSADNRALFLKYSGQSIFNPYVMRGSNVKKMLGEMAGKSISMTLANEDAEPMQPAPSGFAPLVSRREPLVAPTPRVAPKAPIRVERTTAPAPLASSLPKRAPSGELKSEPGFFDRLLSR
jgi:Sensors of blue-light using FAD